MPPQHEQQQQRSTEDVDVRAAMNFQRAASFLTDALAIETAAERQPDHVALRDQVSSGSLDRSAPHLNAVWRQKVSEWCYQVVDHVDESREVVYRAMNILDRYLASEEISADCRTDRDAYQAAAMTSLLLAAHGLRRRDTDGSWSSPPKFGAGDLVRAGRGNVTAEDVEATARKVLNCVSLRSGPSPACLVRPILALFRSDKDVAIAKDAHHSILDCAAFLSELSVCDSSFVGVRSSVVAVASVKVAVEETCDEALSGGARSRFYSCIENVLGLSVDSSEVTEAARRLRSVCVDDAADEQGQAQQAQPQDADDASASSVIDVVPCDEREVEQPSMTTSSSPVSTAATSLWRAVSCDEIAIIPNDEQDADAPSPKRRCPREESSSLMHRAKRSRNLAAIIEE